MSSYIRRWRTSLRGRLIIGYLVVVAVLAGTWGWSLADPLTEATVTQRQSALIAVANAGAVVLAQDDADTQHVVDRLVANTRIRMTVVAADGTVLADSEEDAAQMENHGYRPEIISAFDGDTGVARRISETQDTERVYVAVPAMLGGERVALRVSESIDDINALAASSRRNGLLLLALALVIASILVTRLTAIAALPIERLSTAAHAMAAGDLSSPVPDVPGDLGVLSAALTDLKDQISHRLLDLESERRNLRELLDTLPQAVFLLEDDTVLFANRAAVQLFPGRDLERQGASISACGLPASALAVIDSPDAGEQSVDCGPDPDGRYLRVTTLPLSRVGDHRRSLVIVDDVTERMRVDDLRRDFVANASHELKTPTAGIQLLAESAATAAADGDTDTALEFARQISAESVRLNRMVMDLLDLSRLEATPVPGSVTDVRESIANALAGHRGAASRHGLNLVYDDSHAAGQDTYVRADATDVAIALDNLLDNAITYTDTGEVRVSLSIDADAVHVAVSDTGAGIPAADLPRIFERFFRVDRARVRESGGTGLGLALVRHAAERSGGTVAVRSQEGIGSTFTLSLPRQV